MLRCGMQCAICDQNNASVYSDQSEDWYCVECYEEYEISINCDCENGCKKCGWED